jgi:phosphoglucomutase
MLATEILAVDQAGTAHERYRGARAARVGEPVTPAPTRHHRGGQGAAGGRSRRPTGATELAGRADHRHCSPKARGQRRRAGAGSRSWTDGGWFAARPSGTEDVYKIYAESFRDADHLARIQEEARPVVDAALGG